MRVLRRIHTLCVAVFLYSFACALALSSCFVGTENSFFYLVNKSVFQSTIRVYECVLEYVFFLFLKVKRIGFWRCIFPSLGRPTKVHSCMFLTPSSFQFSFVIRFFRCYFLLLTIDLRLVTLRMFVFNNLKLDKVFFYRVWFLSLLLVSIFIWLVLTLFLTVVCFSISTFIRIRHFLYLFLMYACACHRHRHFSYLHVISMLFSAFFLLFCSRLHFLRFHLDTSTCLCTK